MDNGLQSNREATHPDKKDQEFNHWQFEFDNDKIMWLKLDRQYSSVNSLDQNVLAEFNRLLDKIPELSHAAFSGMPIALIIYSAKTNGFIAGADITQFAKVQSVQEGLALMLQAQSVLKKLASIPFPTLALIHGYCLGGGLEFALACRYRFAADSHKTILGLPEVNLGLHPGWGGTVRLPQLIGIHRAMKMMLTGKPLSSTQALAWGLVDNVFPENELLKEAKSFVLQLTKQELSTHNSGQGYKQPKLMQKIGQKLKLINDQGDWSSWVRVLASTYYYRWLNLRLNKWHYPAAYAIVDNWRQEGISPSAYNNEAESIARLMITETSQQLTRMFLLKAKMKSSGRKFSSENKHIHLIGCGHLGSSLVFRAIQQGFVVSVQDKDIYQLKKLIKKLHETQRKNAKDSDVATLSDRLIIDEKGEEICNANIIIEAVNEELTLKQQVLKEIAQKKSANAMVLTTTATFNFNELTELVPELNPFLLGFHFPLDFRENIVVEVVKSTHTLLDLIDQAAGFVTRLGFLPIITNALPGYLLLRVMIPYIRAAMCLVDEKISVAKIDQAACFFGMRIGPLAIADVIGLDTCKKLMQQLPETHNQVLPNILVRKIQLGHWGIKQGQGFYSYPKHHIKTLFLLNNTDVRSDALTDTELFLRKPDTADLTTPRIIQRLIPVLIESAMKVKSEGVIQDDDLFDSALVFGAGFADFRGGPLNYTNYFGFENIKSVLNHPLCGS